MILMWMEGGRGGLRFWFDRLRGSGGGGHLCSGGLICCPCCVGSLSIDLDGYMFEG